jgi:hypothetical protein
MGSRWPLIQIRQNLVRLLMSLLDLANTGSARISSSLSSNYGEGLRSCIFGLRR